MIRAAEATAADWALDACPAAHALNLVKPDVMAATQSVAVRPAAQGGLAPPLAA